MSWFDPSAWPLVVPTSLLDAVEALPWPVVPVLVVLSVAHLLFGGRLDDDGATLGTALSGFVAGAAFGVVAVQAPVGEPWRALGGGLLGSALALWADAFSVRAGLVIAGGVCGHLSGEMLGFGSGPSQVAALVLAVVLPWIHAPFPRAASAGVAAVVLGWTRVLPAGPAGVVAAWGVGMSVQIWSERAKESGRRQDLPGAGV